MSINRASLGKTYGPVELAVEAERVAAYVEATGDRLDGAVAPPVFGIVPVWPAIRQALADDELGLDVGRIVHGEQRMTFHRLVRAGDRLTSTGTVSSIDERGENEILVLSFETRDAGGSPVTSQEVVCVSRGTGSGPRAPRSSAPAAEPDAEPALRRAVELPPDVTYRYAEASGDESVLPMIRASMEFLRAQGLRFTNCADACGFLFSRTGEAKFLDYGLQLVRGDTVFGNPGKDTALNLRNAPRFLAYLAK